MAQPRTLPDNSITDELDDAFRQQQGSAIKWRPFLKILRNGCVPRHVAVILDGNRRFAREHHVPMQQGYKEGAKAMTRIGCFLFYLGTKELTMYILSVHNLKSRTPEELKRLLDAFNAVLNFALERHLESLLVNKVCIRFIGDLSLLPADLAAKAARLELLTHRIDEDYSMKLNFAIAYGSRHNIVRVSRNLEQAIAKGIINAKDVNYNLLTAALDVEECPAVDLLLRTSGERRLSDFMLWQTAFSLCYFCVKNLPEFGFWDFAHMILNYQLAKPVLQNRMTKSVVENPKTQKVLKAVRKFTDESRTEALLKIAGMKK